VSGERPGQRAHRGDLLIRWEDAALQLERGEAEVGREAPGLGHDPLRVERRTPTVQRRTADRVFGPAVEQVRAVLHPIADLPAEQGVHGQAEGLAERVEAGDLEAGDNGQPQLLGGPHPAQPAGVHGVGDPARLGAHALGQGEQTVQIRDRPPGQRPGQRACQVQITGVAVRLADAGGAVRRDHLDDQPRGVRLVDALGVQQRRIRDQHRGQPYLGDGERRGTADNRHPRM
jgi:hypothetical protein